MATDLRASLTRISEKSRFLTQRYMRVQQERDQALDELRSLQQLLDERNKEIQTLKMQLEYLSVVSTIVPSRDAIESTRAKIAGLVRDIDRCIADLKE